VSKAEHSKETYRKILGAARELFADQGYEATGVALICQAAGVSKGAFYHHFPTKQAVLLAILDEWLLALKPGLDLWAGQDRPAPETLTFAAAAAGTVFEGDPRTRRLLLELWSLAGRDPAVAEAARDQFRRYTSGLAGVLQRGSKDGSLRKLDPDAGGRVLVSLAVGTLLSSLLDPSRADWGAVLNEGVAMLLNGIAQET
jgi:AcrR family transcriptional regulator